MSEWDKKLLRYGKMFEEEMMNLSVNIPLEKALDLGWKIMADNFEPFETGIKSSLIDEFWHDKKAHAIAKSAIKKGILLGALCIAPVILAEAGVLCGKKATVFESEKDQLISAGAKYTGRPIEFDDNVITCSNPIYTEEFAKQIVKAVLKRK